MSNNVGSLSRYLPWLNWGRQYHREWFANDLVAAIIVTMMLIPQSLAYAMLANLPPQVGLYASILPLVGYALFGTSRTLAVGPVAVASLMSAAAAGHVAMQGTQAFYEASIMLAFLGGAMLVLLSLIRAGAIGNLLSHPVVSGFIIASAVLIAAGQLKHLFGVSAKGETLVTIIPSLYKSLATTNRITLLIGVLCLVFLLGVRKYGKATLMAVGLSQRVADIAVKAGPVLTVIVSTLVVSLFDLEARGVKVVGHIPGSLPSLTLPSLDLIQIKSLLVPAFLIALIGFVESVSVGHTLGAKRRQRIDPNQELMGLGAANIASALSGGYSVTGGFSRSVVNFDAGAETPLAGVFTAVGILIVTVAFTPYLANLPQATLAATIIVAVLSLVRFDIFREVWNYSKADFAAVAATVIVVLMAGVEMGVLTGVLLSILLLLAKISKPHIAVTGRVPGTDHFRNILRHEVIQSESVLSLRVDESLYFPNARYLEDALLALVADRPGVQHVVLQASAINDIDSSALESLESIEASFKDMGVILHLSEVKGPVMDKLKNTHFLKHLRGQVFLSHHQAMETLDPATLVNTVDASR
ncbi:MAG: sulfate permease [Thiobacillaceae bacterium]